MAYTEIKRSGVTEKTPQNIVLGAGTIHKNLTFAASTGVVNFDESLWGATSGGTTLTITPEFLDIEVDGVTVATKGLKQKVGETATIETNMIELTEELIKAAVIGADGTSTAHGYDVIESKDRIADGDYIENLAYIGEKINGDPIIIVFDYALLTSGLAMNGQNKQAGTYPVTFTCHADVTENVEKLPYHIYMPTPTA